MNNAQAGISGIAAHVPPFRVDLKKWCDWTGNDWNKIRDVVGTGFRLPGPQHSVYTMAANAVLKLIESYDVDPNEVRFLALGTESSTDNSAGAVILKGMVDEALRELESLSPRQARVVELRFFAGLDVEPTGARLDADAALRATIFVERECDRRFEVQNLCAGQLG